VGESASSNRSHYEDVLTVRVHKLVEKAVWKERFDQINAFEQLLASEGTTIVKFFCTSATKSSANACKIGSAIRRSIGR